MTPPQSVIPVFIYVLSITKGSPSITNIATVSTTSLNVSWAHSVAGQPTSYYLITYICLANGSNSVYHEKRTLTVPAGNTYVVLNDVELPPGSVHVVVVTSVSGDVSRSSELEYINICKMPQTFIFYHTYRGTSEQGTLWGHQFCPLYIERLSLSRRSKI